jgi:hypothetical protein
LGDINNIKFEPHVNLPNFQFGPSGKKSQGGDGGTIMIFAEQVVGSGAMLADGGDGEMGGKGGNIHIETRTNNFKGKISANGGKSVK